MGERVKRKNEMKISVRNVGKNEMKNCALVKNWQRAIKKKK